MSRRKSSLDDLPLQFRTATPSSVRAVNRSIVLELIRRRQPISRADIARLTGIFRSSVSDIIDELLEEDLVTEERAQPFQRGRVPVSLHLNDLSYPVLGLNLRPAYCQMASAGLNGRIHDTLVFETPGSPANLVQAVGRATKQLQSRLAAGNPKVNFRSIGIAVPGHVDAPTGRILWTPTHHELAGFPITRHVQQRTGIEARADNDCNVGALSELWLASSNENNGGSDFVFLNVSDFGTGAGAVLQGKVYLGHNSHFAAEVGHMVIEQGGTLCRCGRRGCWERYVSNEATWQRLHPRTPFNIDGFNQMIEAARSDARVRNCFRETARYLSLGISNIAFLFNPAEIVIAGRITAVWDVIEKDVESLYAAPQVKARIRPARLSADDSLLHGAVCLALRDAFAKPEFGEVPRPAQRVTTDSITRRRSEPT